jgi:hypothetical protein
MTIRRYTPRRRSNSSGYLGCIVFFVMALLACGVVLLIFAPRLSGIAASVAGFQASGDTSGAFVNAPQVAAPPVNNASSPQAITVTIPDYGTRTLPIDPLLTTVSVGTDTAGAPLATARVTEEGALALCRQYTPICANGDPRLQNLSIDFREGGAVVYGDVSLPEFGGVTQRVGAVLRVDPSGRQLQFVGIDLGGQLYSAPADALGIDIRQLEAVANQALRSASITANGQPFTPNQIVIDDRSATLVLR